MTPIIIIVKVGTSTAAQVGVTSVQLAAIAEAIRAHCAGDAISAIETSEALSGMVPAFESAARAAQQAERDDEREQMRKEARSQMRKGVW